MLNNRIRVEHGTGTGREGTGNLNLRREGTITLHLLLNVSEPSCHVSMRLPTSSHFRFHRLWVPSRFKLSLRATKLDYSIRPTSIPSSRRFPINVPALLRSSSWTTSHIRWKVGQVGISIFHYINGRSKRFSLSPDIQLFVSRKSFGSLFPSSRCINNLSRHSRLAS